MSITSPDDADLRQATADEMRALAHPLRLRILRLTLNEPLTNKEIAERVGRDPGTVLHHIGVLVEGGFLAAEPTRRGRRSALERPYRSTGKSWQIRLTPDAGHAASVLDAVREELLEAEPDATIVTLRLGTRLRPADIIELKQRIRLLGDDFAARDDPAGDPVGILALAHRRVP